MVLDGIGVVDGCWMMDIDDTEDVGLCDQCVVWKPIHYRCCSLIELEI